jgi:hypothetical protein
VQLYVFRAQLLGGEGGLQQVAGAVARGHERWRLCMRAAARHLMACCSTLAPFSTFSCSPPDQRPRPVALLSTIDFATAQALSRSHCQP